MPDREVVLLRVPSRSSTCNRNVASTYLPWLSVFEVEPSILLHPVLRSGVHVALSLSCLSVRSFLAERVQIHARMIPSVLLVFRTQSRSVLVISVHAFDPRLGEETVNDARGIGSVTVRLAVRFRP